MFSTIPSPTVARFCQEVANPPGVALRPLLPTGQETGSSAGQNSLLWAQNVPGEKIKLGDAGIKPASHLELGFQPG